jgi:hypothetical protein
MPTYDLGDGIELEKLVYVDNVLTAAVVALTVTKPDGTPIAPNVTNPSLGTYLAETVPLDQTGVWEYVWTISGAVIDHDEGTFTVLDPAPPAYTTPLLVKAGLGKTTVDDRDDLIAGATIASSRMIDERTGRRFYLDRAASSRIYTRTAGSGRIYFDRQHLAYVISVDDIGEAASMVVEVGSTVSGAWSAVTGYTTGPDNAIARGRPITTLIMPYGWEPSLWLWEVRVTARWGWPAVPTQIAEASRMLAARLYRRKDSPQGVIGNAEWGIARVSRLDPDVEALVAPFTLPGFA